MSTVENSLEVILKRARMRLPVDVKEYPNSDNGQACGLGSVARFEEFLHHAEYELAIDELIPLGRINNMDSLYWQDILSASLQMNLDDHAKICKEELGKREA